MLSDSNCLFCKMVAGQMETKTVYEDEAAFAFHDIDPQAPVHILIIPKQHLSSLKVASNDQEQLLGHLLNIANKIAKDLGIDESGYRIVINTGRDAGQAVGHLHVHLLGGREMTWPPG